MSFCIKNIEEFVEKLRKILENEMKFGEPEEIFNTSLRFKKKLILQNIFNILIGKINYE